MLKFVVTRNGQEADIRFPCEEKDIRRVQNKLDIPYETDTRVKILAVDSDIEQLSALEGQAADLDFLNLLGRLMYGMDKHEYDQFRMGLYYETALDLKTIINISRAVNRYSIITEDLHKSGLDHELDIRGGIPTSEVDVTDYSLAAKKLLDSGKCIDTPYKTTYEDQTYENIRKNPIKQVNGQVYALKEYLMENGVYVWVSGYVLMLQGNSPVRSERVLNSTSEIDYVIHTPGRKMLDENTIYDIRQLLAPRK